MAIRQLGTLFPRNDPALDLVIKRDRLFPDCACQRFARIRERHQSVRVNGVLPRFCSDTRLTSRFAFVASSLLRLLVQIHHLLFWQRRMILGSHRLLRLGLMVEMQERLLLWIADMYAMYPTLNQKASVATRLRQMTSLEEGARPPVRSDDIAKQFTRKGLTGSRLLPSLTTATAISTGILSPSMKGYSYRSS